MKYLIIYLKLTSIFVFIFPVLLRFSFIEKSSTVFSQTKDQCTEQLDKAQHEYNLGNFQNAIDLIEPCLKKPGVSKAVIERGYKLLGLVYIGQQLKKEASEALKKLLLIAPNYKINPSKDSPELKKIIEETAPTLVPQISGITPDSVDKEKGGFILFVSGSNLVYGSEIRFNGKAKPTTFISNKELKAEIPASDMLKEGDYDITVFSPIMGGSLSNTAKLKVLGTSSGFPWSWIAIGGGAVAVAVVAILTLGGKSNTNGGTVTTLADPPGRP